MKLFFALSVFLFAAMIAAAQQQSPEGSQRAQKVAKPAVDPFQRFRYRMAYSTQGKYLAGFSDVVVKGDRSRATEHARRVQGMNKSSDITLKRGVVRTDSSFAQWVSRSKASQQLRDVVLDSFDEAGRKSSSMHLGGCVVSEYQSTPELDGPANSATIQVMTLHCASLQRSKL